MTTSDTRAAEALRIVRLEQAYARACAERDAAHAEFDRLTSALWQAERDLEVARSRLVADASVARQQVIDERRAHDRTRRELAEAVAEIATLRECYEGMRAACDGFSADLRRYGQHDTECEQSYGLQCTCGLRAALGEEDGDG